jgi:hypothetical protein
MSREIRKVPRDWEHPKEFHTPLEGGFEKRFKPLLDRNFEQDAREWWTNAVAWQTAQDTGDLSGLDDWNQEHWNGDYWPEEEGRNLKEAYPYFWMKDNPPQRGNYRPAWADEERTHYQMYETVSEGTPRSPVFATLQELEDWLIEDGYWEEFDGLRCGAIGLGPNPASRENPGWFSEKCSRKAAKAFCKSKWCPSGIGFGGVYYPGPEGLVAAQKNEGESK